MLEFECPQHSANPTRGIKARLHLRFSSFDRRERADKLRPVHTCNFCCTFTCDFLPLIDVNKSISYGCANKATITSEQS